MIIMEQCGCLNVTSTYHWALYLGADSDQGEGTLFHSCPSTITAATSLASDPSQCVGRRKNVYERIVHWRPQDSDKRIVMRVPVARGVPPNKIERAGIQIDKKYPYHLLTSNCQHWVIRVLRTLVQEGYVMQKEYGHTAEKIQKFAPSCVAKW